MERATVSVQGMSVSLREAVERMANKDGVVRTKNASLADAPREDGSPWVLVRIPEVSQAEKNKIRKRNGKI